MAPLASLDLLPQLSYKIQFIDYSDNENVSICKFNGFFFFKLKTYFSALYLMASRSISLGTDLFM